MTSPTLTPEQRLALRAIARRLDGVLARLGRELRPRATSSEPLQAPGTTLSDYVILPTEKVDAAKRRAVEAVLQRAQADLGLPALTVVWFRHAEPWERRGDEAIARLANAVGEPITEQAYVQGKTGTAGLYRFREPTVVYVDATRTPLQAALIAAHEARHAWQHAHGHIGKHANAWTPERAEEDADEYALQITLEVRPA